MRFPDKLTVVAQEAGSGSPIANVALVLRLFAAQKNDYYVGPSITNESGVAEFSCEDCESAIQVSKEMFLMDYVGNLASCRPLIEVSLHPADRLLRMRQQYENTPSFWGRWFKEPERVFAALAKVRNADYEPSVIQATEQECLANSQLGLILDKRS